MARHEPASPSAKARRVTRNHPWLGIVMEAADSQLRRRLGVSDYTRSSNCILRMQITRSTEYIALKDGTCLRPGDRIIDLHFWNKQVPLIPEEGPTFGWARLMSDCFKRSLQELAHHLAARTDVDDVVAVRAIAALGADTRGDQISRIMSHFGFETVYQQTPSVTEQIRRYGENILISLMVLAYNTIALRPDTLKRGRMSAYMSRRVLDDRYGAAQRKACRLPGLPQPQIYEAAGEFHVG